MSKVDPAIIGAFVVSAIAILVGAVLVLGSGKLFRHTHTFVLFFKTDVEGLRIGAPVKFKGVRVGVVKQIVLALSQCPRTRKRSRNLRRVGNSDFNRTGCRSYHSPWR